MKKKSSKFDCGKCGSDLTQENSLYKVYYQNGHFGSTGELVEDGSLDGSGDVACTECGTIQ